MVILNSFTRQVREDLSRAQNSECFTFSNEDLKVNYQNQSHHLSDTADFEL